jgi:hypothetical protein
MKISLSGLMCIRIQYFLIDVTIFPELISFEVKIIDVFNNFSLELERNLW